MLRAFLLVAHKGSCGDLVRSPYQVKGNAQNPFTIYLDSEIKSNSWMPSPPSEDGALSRTSELHGAAILQGSSPGSEGVERADGPLL